MNLYNTLKNTVISTVAASTIALSGCRANHPDMTAQDTDYLIASEHFNKEVIGAQPKEFVAQWKNAFVMKKDDVSGIEKPTGIVVNKIPSLNESNLAGLSTQELETLRSYRTFTQNVDAATRGSYIVAAKVFSEIKDMRETLGNWMNLSQDEKDKIEQNFILNIGQKYAADFREANTAYNRMIDSLTQEEREQTRTNIRNIEAKLNANVYDAQAAKEIRNLFDVGNKNIQAYEKWLNLDIACDVLTGNWGSNVHDQTVLISQLEEARGAYTIEELSDMVHTMKNKDGTPFTIEFDGEQQTLNAYRKQMIDKAITHFAHDDDNCRDDIFQDNRFPVASAYARFAAKGFADNKIDTSQHKACILTLDDMISQAATDTKPDYLYRIFDKFVEALPVGYDLFKMGTDVEYLFTPNGPTGDAEQIIDSIMKSYGGFNDADNIVRKEQVAARMFIRAVLAAAKYTTTVIGAKNIIGGGHGSNGNGGGSSDPSPKKGISGSETGGNGIK